MCLLITLFNILINKKAGHLGKRKTDSSARERTRKLHTSEYKNSCFEIFFFFIPMKVQLIIISSAIPYISGINSTSSSLNTGKISRKRKEEGKRGRESVNEREKKKEKEKEKEKAKEKEKEKKEEKEEEEKEEEEKMEKAVLKVLL